MSNKMSFLLPKILTKFKYKDEDISIPLPSWMSRLFLTMENDFNYLRGITYSQLTLSNDDIPVGKTNLGEIHYPLILLVTSYNTTDATGIDLGGYFRWDPAAFPAGSWYFEASIYSENAAATASCLLKGSGTVTTLTSAETSLDRKRSAALTMPETAQNLWVVLKTSNGSYNAYIRSAKLIFVP